MNAKTIKQYIVLSSISSFGKNAIFATYATFLLGHGLNLFQLNLVNVVFFTTLLIFEIPTGAFADICGRKLSYVISCAMVSVAALIYSASHNFLGFAVAECIYGIGSTFANGAFKAWVVDKLLHNNYQGSMRDVFKKAQVYTQVSGIFGILLGSRLSIIDERYPWFMVSLVLLITTIIAFFWLKEEYFTKKEFSFKSHYVAMKEVVKHSIEFGIKNNIIRFLFMVGLIQALAMQAPNMQWQPYFIQGLGDKQYLGYLSVAMNIAIALGSYFINHFIKMIKDDEKAIVACQIITGVMIATLVLLPYPFNMFMFVLHEIPRGIFSPLKDNFLQKNIPSKARATISSFDSVYPHLGGIIGLLCSGFLANKYGIANTWIAAGVLMTVLTITAYKLSFKNKYLEVKVENAEASVES